jgi:hypothetical protein
MRKLAGVLAAAVAALAVAVAPGIAQDGDRPVTKFNVKAKITPKKTGTKRNPRGVKLTGTVKWRTVTQGVEPPVITGSDMLLPKHGVYNGGKYVKCSKRTLDRTGPRGCPKKSRMGSATGVAFADLEKTVPKVELFNGGKSTLYAYTTLFNPAFVQETVVIKIRKIKHRIWGYRVKFRVPRNLQIVTGVPIALRSLKFNVGGKPYAREFITTTGCPKSKKLPFQVKTYYRYSNDTRSSSSFRSTVACR